MAGPLRGGVWGAQVDINVRVTAAAAASASAQPNAKRPAESTQPNIAGFFGKRPAQKEPAPEMVGAPGRERPKRQKNTTTVVHKGTTCAAA